MKPIFLSSRRNLKLAEHINLRFKEIKVKQHKHKRVR